MSTTKAKGPHSCHLSMPSWKLFEWKTRPFIPSLPHAVSSAFEFGYGGFPKLGVLFGDSHNKGYSLLGSILGSPYLGKLPYVPTVKCAPGASLDSLRVWRLLALFRAKMSSRCVVSKNHGRCPGEGFPKLEVPFWGSL